MKMQKQIGAGLLVALLLSANAFAAHVVLKDGTTRRGSGIRATATGDIVLTTERGNVTFTKDQVLSAHADEPKEYAAAQRAMSAKKYDEAIKLLDTIVKNYRYLTWDVTAGRLLGQAYVGAGKPDEAVKAYERVLSSSPAERLNADTMWGMRAAMLAAGQYGPLIRQLDEVAAKGSRVDAARAQNMRGDVQLKQNNLNEAVFDYLRTAILFQDVKDPVIQGEAAFKAAQVLETLKDARAKDMYRKVVSQYPSSPYASQARSKI